MSDSAHGVELGLNLLPVETFFEPINEKITRRSEAQVDASALRGLFANMHGQRFQAYQIHVGRTVIKGRNSQGGTYAFEMYPTYCANTWISIGSKLFATSRAEEELPLRDACHAHVYNLPAQREGVRVEK